MSTIRVPSGRKKKTVQGPPAQAMGQLHAPEAPEQATWASLSALIYCKAGDNCDLGDQSDQGGQGDPGDQGDPSDHHVGMAKDERPG